jgi:hypothetical protein
VTPARSWNDSGLTVQTVDDTFNSAE